MQTIIARTGQFSPGRKVSLYSDFRHLKEGNIVGFEANVTAWKQILFQSVDAGSIGTHRVILAAGPHLVEQAHDAANGDPLALDAVIDELVQRQELVPLAEFMRDGYYLPNSPNKSLWNSISISGALGWAISKTGLYDRMWKSATYDRKHQKYILKTENYVVVDLLEKMALKVLHELHRSVAKSEVSSSSNGYAMHVRMFERIVLAAFPELSMKDMQAIVRYLWRDYGLICVDAESKTLKLGSAARKLGHDESQSLQNPSQQLSQGLGSGPEPIDDKDIAVAELREAIFQQQGRVLAMSRQFDKDSETIRTALASKNHSLAKAALRSRKSIEQNQTKALQLLENLQYVYDKIEEADSHAATLAALESGAKMLEQINASVDVDKAESVMDQVREQAEAVDDLGRQLERERELDSHLSRAERKQQDEELEQELAELEQQALTEAKSRKKKTSESDLDIDRLAQRLGNLGMKPASPRPVKDKESRQKYYAE